VGSRFVRVLLITAVLQFFATRARAGRVEEEGAAELLWMLYPLNVVLSAVAWTLALRALGALTRPLRRA
jgi:hypothetical protein